MALPKRLSRDMSGNLGVPRGLPKWKPLELHFIPQHGPSWGLRFWAPNRFFMIWGRASWSRIWAGLQNRYCHFREHSVETERSFFLKIHFGRGVHVEAENGSPFDGVARQGSNWRVPDEAPKWRLKFQILGSILEGLSGGWKPRE